MTMRRAILAAILCSVFAPAVAFAHAAYRDSDPKDEATVPSPPSSVWAEYTEPVQEGYLNIFDPCGVQVDDGNTQITGYRMTVGMSADTAGTYSVRWKAASAVDPHVTSGTFTFTVSDGTACAGTEPEDDDGSSKDPGEADDPNEPVSNDDRAEEPEQSDSAGAGRGDARRGGGDDVKGERIMKGRRSARAAAPDGADEMAVAQAEIVAADRGLLEGIPLDGFLIALAVAAAIGAAGGRIYANIMGPRR